MHKMRIVSIVSVALAVLAVPQTAAAFLNVGAEGGVVKRSADSPNNLKLGVGYGLHGELSLLPLIKFGPYYLHYELSSADRPALAASDAVFNTFGLRARLTLPIPGGVQPYGYVGAGYTWVNYAPALGDQRGHFIETPLGVGLAHDFVEIFQLSLDFAWRPGFGFGGDAYDGVLQASRPSSGWSLMLGLALNL
jgi:opacity protein-like surface antigen